MTTLSFPSPVIRRAEVIAEDIRQIQRRGHSLPLVDLELLASILVAETKRYLDEAEVMAQAYPCWLFLRQLVVEASDLADRAGAKCDEVSQ